MSLPLSFAMSRSPFDCAGQTQQFGANMKYGAIRGRRIDFKADFAAFHNESDNHVFSGSSVSYREYADSLRGCKNGQDALTSRGTDE
jgi:hypothetical protein